jgi:hypothetical protein
MEARGPTDRLSRDRAGRNRGSGRTGSTGPMAGRSGWEKEEAMPIPVESAISSAMG